MNSTTRTFAMMPPAFLVTSGLIMVMVSLIGVQHEKTERIAAIPLPEIAAPQEEVVEAKVIEKPEKPPVDETPPPEVTKQPFEKLAVSTQLKIVDPGRFKVEPKIEKSGTLGDTSAQIIFRVAPIYPMGANGIEGDVIVQYTITANGSVRDAVIVSSTSPIFNKEALKSVLKYRYKPRIINGQAVETTGKQIVIKFRVD